jgi:plasmid stabilization system protein ParE
MIDLAWEDKASDMLADIYVAVGPQERELVALEIQRLHRQLRTNPLDVGESRAPFVRVVVRASLTIWFRVSAEATRVRIFHVSHRPNG